jgi:hypothetical protein
MLKAIAHHRLEERPEDLIENRENRKEQIRRQVTVLREYAKWRLLRDYAFPPSRESHRRDLMREFFQMGAQAQLTERDMVLLLLRGLLCDRSCPPGLTRLLPDYPPASSLVYSFCILPSVSLQ